MMKTKIIIALIVLFSTKCFSQITDSLTHNLDLFFNNEVDYPYTLAKNCIPTITVLKIDIDRDGHIANMKLSDSADPLLNFEFIRVMDKLNTSSIEKYAKIKSLKNISILIPVYYSFHYSLTYGHCPSPTSRVSTLVNLMKFNGEDFTDNAIILPPVFNLISEAIE